MVYFGEMQLSILLYEGHMWNCDEGCYTNTCDSCLERMKRIDKKNENEKSSCVDTNESKISFVKNWSEN